jgi:hypothetical protein
MKTYMQFFIISRSFLLRMKNGSDKSCRENQNTHFVFSNFFLKSCRLWDVEKYCRAGQASMTTWRMRIACWIPKATNTHTSYMICDTLRLWNTQYSSTTTTVVRTRLNVTLYAHCPSCSNESFHDLGFCPSPFLSLHVFAIPSLGNRMPTVKCILSVTSKRFFESCRCHINSSTALRRWGCLSNKLLDRPKVQHFLFTRWNDYLLSFHAQQP